MISLYVFFSAFSQALVFAMTIDLARPTLSNTDVDPQGVSPRPTQAPRLPVDLRRRQFVADAADHVLIAPDNICGYVDGLPGTCSQRMCMKS